MPHTGLRVGVYAKMSDPNMAYRGLPGMGYICDGSVFDVWIFYF